MPVFAPVELAGIKFNIAGIEQIDAGFNINSHSAAVERAGNSPDDIVKNPRQLSGGNFGTSVGTRVIKIVIFSVYEILRNREIHPAENGERASGKKLKTIEAVGE